MEEVKNKLSISILGSGKMRGHFMDKYLNPRDVHMGYCDIKYGGLTLNLNDIEYDIHFQELLTLEYLKPIKNTILRSVNAIMILIDPSDTTCFDNLVEEINSYKSISGDIPLVLVFVHCDDESMLNIPSSVSEEITCVHPVPVNDQESFDLLIKRVSCIALSLPDPMHSNAKSARK